MRNELFPRAYPFRNAYIILNYLCVVIVNPNLKRLTLASTAEGFIKGYFDWMIILINCQKVHQGVFQPDDHPYEPLEGGSNGISIG